MTAARHADVPGTEARDRRHAKIALLLGCGVLVSASLVAVVVSARATGEAISVRATPMPTEPSIVAGPLEMPSIGALPTTAKATAAPMTTQARRTATTRAQNVPVIATSASVSAADPETTYVAVPTASEAPAATEGEVAAATMTTTWHRTRTRSRTTVYPLPTTPPLLTTEPEAPVTTEPAATTDAEMTP